MGDTEHFADPKLNHLIVQGADNSGFGWDFGQSFGLDFTDAWTQLLLIGGMMFAYGAFLIFYVCTKKWDIRPQKKKPESWKAWDNNDVQYNLPVTSRHNDFLGWRPQDNSKDIEGRIYLYCLPTNGPYTDFKVYVKQRVLKRLKLANLPYRGFFFRGRDNHLKVDRINAAAKESFKSILAAVQETELIHVPSLAISLPKDPETGCYTIKFTPNFVMDKDFEQAIIEAFERLKPDLVEFNNSEGATPSILEPIIKMVDIETKC